MEIRKFKEAYNLCLLFQSRLGILENKLLYALEDEFEKNKSIYELLHHKNQILLSCQLFRLAKKCKQKTPENFEKLIKEVLYTTTLNTITSLSDFSENLLQLDSDLFPKYPVENHEKIIEIYNRIVGYYSVKPDKTYVELLLKINFYGNWKDLLESSEKNSDLYWVDRILELVYLEPNNDNRVTILNIIKRNCPRIEEYINRLES